MCRNKILITQKNAHTVIQKIHGVFRQAKTC